MAPAQRSPPGSTMLSEMENDVPVPGDPQDDLALGRCGGPSRAAPQTAAQPTALTAVSAAAPQRGAGPPASPAFPSQPGRGGRGAKHWSEGERMGERDPGAAGGARTGRRQRSGVKPAGERGRTPGGHWDKLFSSTPVCKLPAKLLP